MSERLINVSELNAAMTDILSVYQKDSVRKIKTLTRRAMNDLVKATKATAPVGKRYRHYRDSISSKKLFEDRDGMSMLWYVKGSDYRLSHLLNNGHVLRDGGRYPGTNFIGKAVDTLLPFYVRDIEEALRDGK